MSITKIIPTIMAARLASENLEYFTRRKKRKKLTRLAVENITGSSLISETANFV